MSDEDNARAVLERRSMLALIWLFKVCGRPELAAIVEEELKK